MPHVAMQRREIPRANQRGILRENHAALKTPAG
jgi:hypothetical protein